MFLKSFLIQNLKLLDSENPKFALIRLLHVFFRLCLRGSIINASKVEKRILQNPKTLKV